MTGPTLRRLLHAASGLVLVIVPVSSWNVFRYVLLGLGGVGVVLEILRLSSSRVRSRLQRLLPVFRAREQAGPSGAMWLGVGYALAALTPAPAPAAGILVAALADPTASLVGTWRRNGGRKTWRGTLAHAVVATGVLAVLGWPFAAVLGGTAVATALERLAVGVDDNLLVAPATALTVTLLG